MSKTSQKRHQLAPRQINAIECLMTSKNIVAASERADVPRRTMTKWLADPDFLSALKSAQNEATAQAVRRLAGAMCTAVQTICDLAESSEDENVRLRAALAVPGTWRELTTATELEERILALEAGQATS